MQIMSFWGGNPVEMKNFYHESNETHSGWEKVLKHYFSWFEVKTEAVLESIKGKRVINEDSIDYITAKSDLW